jgi:hypothetical protein
VKVTVGAALVAVVVCPSVVPLKLLSAAHVAVSVQVPVPLVIVTAVPTLEQTPPDVMTAVVLAFVDDATVNPA